MAHEWAKPFYNSAQWKRCRDAYISKRLSVDGGLCEECHEQPGHIVHHKVALTPDNINDPDVTLDHRLLSYECKACHDRHEGHGNGGMHVRPVCAFDQQGQPIPLGRETDIPPLKEKACRITGDRQPRLV
ncbi:MAG: hypothetical protein NC331_11370 [Lachnospiraceae bacterium]|nr:hypothetical protein [Lachnospiraceae bacterium]MCM1239967.1 hypothetical protein [Lachnospiraceae bacterium]